MDDEGNTRRSGFEEDTLNAMRPERPDFTQEATGNGEGNEETGGSGFYHQNKKDDNKNKQKDAKRYAASDLGDAERNATGLGGGSGNGETGGVDEAKDKESNPSGGYYNSSQKNAGSSSGLGRGIKARLAPLKGKKGGFKKYGALTAMFVVLIVGASASFTSMSSQLNAWKENIYSHYGQNSAVINKRSNFLMRTLLKTNREATSTTIFGKTKFKISTKMADKLREQGIEYVEVEDGNGKKLKMLAYMSDDGTAIPIVADDSDLGRAKGLAGVEMDLDSGKKVKFTDGAMTLSVAKTQNKDFNKALTRGTLTVSGKIAGWFSQFGKIPEMLFERLIGNRARNQTANLDNDSTIEDVKEEMGKPSSIQDGDSETKGRDTSDEEEGEDGQEKTNSEGKTKDQIKGQDGKLTGGDVSAVANKLKAKAEKVASLGSGSSAICGFIKAIGAISATVGAIQTMNAVNFTSKYLEMADKIKAQDANNSINLANQLLNEPQENTVYDVNDIDQNGNPKEIKINKATTESPGFNMAFAQKDVIDEDAPSTQMVNREEALTIALQNVARGTAFEWVGPLLSGVASFGSTLELARTCTGIQIGASVAGLATDIALLVTTGGVGNFVKAFVKDLLSSIAIGAIMAAVGAVVGLIAPMVAQWLGSSLLTVVFGEVGGTVMWAGAQSLMNSNLQMSTGYLPDKAGAMQLLAMTKDVEKEWADYDRIALSPFDTSSQYTFMGSIMNSLTPILNQAGNGVMSTVSSVAQLAGDSTLALVNPTASAADEVYGYELSLASEDNCPRLHSVGAEGTETCHKYNGAYVDDLDTLDPDDIYNRINELEASMLPQDKSFIGEYADGNPKINPNSDFGKFIVACVANDTQPGEVDASVQGFLTELTDTGNTTTDSLLNFGMGLVPFSDSVDLFQGIEEWNNMVWNSKAACTGRAENVGNLNEKIRLYSTYNLDQRVLEELGIIENNAVVAVLDEYYEKNPLDQSFEGQVARYSGQSKEQVEDTLAFMEYLVAVEEYDPSERYAFGESDVKIDKPLRLDYQTEVQVADTREKVANEFAQIIYADVRNRTAVV